MATKKPNIFEVPTDILTDASDAIADEVKKQQVITHFREKQKDLDDLREEKKRIQKENREMREEAKPRTADIRYTGTLAKHLRKQGVKGMGRFVPGTKPEYKDPGDGDLFGEGKVDAGREPWRPVDMKRKGEDGKPATYERGQGGKLTFSDTQPGSSRFVADFETKEFKEKWIKDQLEQRGYATDDGPKALGYGRAKSEVEAMWRKQRSQWLKQKTDFMMGELREQNKKPEAAVAPDQTAAPASQVADAEAAQTAKASAAAASPVKKPESVLADGFSYGKAGVDAEGVGFRPVVYDGPKSKPLGSGEYGPADRTYSVGVEYDNGETLVSKGGKDTMGDKSTAPWLNGKKTITSDDGKITVETEVKAGQYTNPNAAAAVANYNSAHPTGPQELATGSRVGSNGRYMKGGQIFFGDKAAYEKYKKEQGVV